MSRMTREKGEGSAAKVKQMTACRTLLLSRTALESG